MDYLTFYGRWDRWQVLRGASDSDEVLGERANPPLLVDLSAAMDPWLWVCVSTPDRDRWWLERLRLPDLCVEETIPLERRTDALACGPDGRRVAVLCTSEDLAGPTLWLGREGGWRSVAATSPPDLSSRLAWIGPSKIAYENRERRLTVLDVDSGETTIGIPGRSPAAAQATDRWYAVAGSRAVCFELDDHRLARPLPVDGVSFGRVTALRVTHDGEVFTWKEPRFWFGSKSFTQTRHDTRRRLRHGEEGLVGVIGPYEL